MKSEKKARRSATLHNFINFIFAFRNEIQKKRVQISSIKQVLKNTENGVEYFQQEQKLMIRLKFVPEWNVIH